MNIPMMQESFRYSAKTMQPQKYRHYNRSRYSNRAVTYSNRAVNNSNGAVTNLTYLAYVFRNNSNNFKHNKTEQTE